MLKIGERIQFLRVQNEMSQTELGTILGVGRATISKIEKGIITNLKASHVQKLSKIFDVSACFILGLEDEQTKELKTVYDFKDLTQQYLNILKNETIVGLEPKKLKLLISNLELFLE